MEKRELICRNYVVSVRSGFFIILVLGMGCVIYCSTPLAFHLIIVSIARHNAVILDMKYLPYLWNIRNIYRPAKCVDIHLLLSSNNTSTHYCVYRSLNVHRFAMYRLNIACMESQNVKYAWKCQISPYVTE